MTKNGFGKYTSYSSMTFCYCSVAVTPAVVNSSSHLKCFILRLVKTVLSGLILVSHLPQPLTV